MIRPRFRSKCLNKGSPIRDARMAAGLPARELANQVCITYGALAKWERGDVFPEPRKAKRLIRALPALTLDLIYAAL